MKEKVYVLDTTLRDGEQTPGVGLTVDEKVQIALQLDEDACYSPYPACEAGTF